MDSYNTGLIFYIATASVLLVMRIPVAGKFFRGINTLVHESAHALMALLFSGEVLSVELFKDNSGTTITKSKNKFGSFLVALAGYPGSSFMALLFYWLLARQHFTILLLVLGTITLINLVLFIRNMYGIFWLLAFSLILIGAYKYPEESLVFGFCVFCCAMVLFDSIISSFILLMLSFRNPSKAGDAYNLQKITRLPAAIWSFFFFALSVFVGYKIIVAYFPWPILPK